MKFYTDVRGIRVAVTTRKRFFLSSTPLMGPILVYIPLFYENRLIFFHEILYIQMFITLL